jgi:L-lysine 2,3-aminomutase
MPAFEYEYVTYERSSIPEGESENDYVDYFTKRLQDDGYLFLVAHNEEGAQYCTYVFRRPTVVTEQSEPLARPVMPPEEWFVTHPE